MKNSDKVIENLKKIEKYLGTICVLGMLSVLFLYWFDFFNIGTRKPHLFLIIIALGIVITKAKNWFLLFADIYLLLLFSVYFIYLLYPDFAHHYFNWLLY